MGLYEWLRTGRGRPYDGRDLARAALALAGLVAVASLFPRVKDRIFPREALVGDAYVVDGDSLRLHERELRLAGIDAPELHQTCGREGRTVACGREARAAVITKLRGGTLTCRVEGEDRYRRDLVVCSVDGRELNAALVREGFAVSYGDRYLAEEREARAARRGIWAGTFDRPSDWRRTHRGGE